MMSHLGLCDALPRDAAHWPPVLAVVLRTFIWTKTKSKRDQNLKLCQGLDCERLGASGVLCLLHVVEVDFLDVHGVILLQDCLRPLD